MHLEVGYLPTLWPADGRVHLRVRPMSWFHALCDCGYQADGPTLEDAKVELKRHEERVHEKYERENNLPDSRKKETN